MALASDHKGNRLVAFLPMDAVIIPDDERDIPLIFTTTLLRHQDKTVLVFNRSRQVWELPGGGIEAGETPIECAVRETLEESLQDVAAAALRCLGLVKVHLKDVDKMEFGVLYGAELATVTPFAPNNEMDDLLLWDMRSALPYGVLNPIDLKMAQLGLDRLSEPGANA